MKSSNRLTFTGHLWAWCLMILVGKGDATEKSWPQKPSFAVVLLQWEGVACQWRGRGSWQVSWTSVFCHNIGTIWERIPPGILVSLGDAHTRIALCQKGLSQRPQRSLWMDVAGIKYDIWSLRARVDDVCGGGEGTRPWYVNCNVRTCLQSATKTKPMISWLTHILPILALFDKFPEQQISKCLIYARRFCSFITWMTHLLQTSGICRKVLIFPVHSGLHCKCQTVALHTHWQNQNYCCFEMDLKQATRIGPSRKVNPWVSSCFGQKEIAFIWDLFAKIPGP